MSGFSFPNGSTNSSAVVKLRDMCLVHTRFSKIIAILISISFIILSHHLSPPLLNFRIVRMQLLNQGA